MVCGKLIIYFARNFIVITGLLNLNKYENYLHFRPDCHKPFFKII